MTFLQDSHIGYAKAFRAMLLFRIPSNSQSIRTCCLSHDQCTDSLLHAMQPANMEFRPDRVPV